jgi:hypothetical protein
MKKKNFLNMNLTNEIFLIFINLKSIFFFELDKKIFFYNL